MPRPPRTVGDDIHYHIILRCNNKERLLCNTEDFEDFLFLLGQTKKEYLFRLYNYELLNSHIHLMISTHLGNYIDQIMHSLCFKYAKKYNKRHGRSGHVWAHRYRSRLILDDAHGIACLRYQNRNAFSAGIVERPDQWPWSGYKFYAFGEENKLLESHPSYLSLCEDSKKRRNLYQRLVAAPIPSDKAKSVFEGRSAGESSRFLM